MGSKTIVKVEDFEPIACDYKRGPSYLFTADDGAAFEEACARLPQAVGYFRSHTRDGLSLAPEDIELMEQYFSPPSNVALLVKPFATKVSVASFFFREDGLFPSSAPLEFPFRRRELAGEEAPARRSMLERTPRRRDLRNEPLSEPSIAPSMDYVPQELPEYVPPVPIKAPSRRGWALPLSFVFLLLGIALGFQAAMTMGPKSSLSAAEYSLGLTVVREGANLSVKWDRDAAPVKVAQKGTLEIEENGHTKPYELDSAQLRNGSILFTNSSGTVRFRLIVYPQAALSVTQTLEWGSQ
jgi:hypothetical protein